MATLPQFPSIDFTRLDATVVTDRLQGLDTKVVEIVRDGMYITVGLGVLGVQQAAEFAKTAGAQMQDLRESVRSQVEDTVKTATAQVEDTVSQVRGLVRKAA